MTNNDDQLDGRIIEDAFRFEMSKPSEWECHLFGANGLIFNPKEGDVPNWFWRIMQRLVLGNKWLRVKRDKDDK